MRGRIARPSEPRDRIQTFTRHGAFRGPLSRPSLQTSVRPVGRVPPLGVFRRVAAGRNPFFLDSALPDPELARYSFLGADPIGWFRSRGTDIAYASPWAQGRTRGDPLAFLEGFLADLPRVRAGRPPFPFAGGLVGYLSYDLGRLLERVPEGKPADLGLPDIHMALYADVWVVDHAWGEVYRVRPRVPIRYDPPPIPENLGVLTAAKAVEALPKEAYLESIRAAKAAIGEGQIFQVNLSRRLSFPLDSASPEAYARLRDRTPATFGGYLDAGDHQVLSASPERFLRVKGRDVETRPIKGTRPRGKTPSADEILAQELLRSEKDAAENVMIVDLERNDLGKVCEFGSVHVPVLRGLRTLPTVHHLESVVRGTLRAHVGVADLLRATFPGGSITGAPKPRAMEIIERLEPHRRGVYTGAMGYLAADGSLDLNIAIRTATVIGGSAYFAVGGGIVADSDLEAEYQETLDKLRGHAEALTGDRLRVTAEGLTAR